MPRTSQDQTRFADRAQQASRPVLTRAHAPRPLGPLSKDRVATSLYGSDSRAVPPTRRRQTRSPYRSKVRFTRLKINLLNISLARQRDISPRVRAMTRAADDQPGGAVRKGR